MLSLFKKKNLVILSILFFTLLFCVYGGCRSNGYSYYNIEKEGFIVQNEPVFVMFHVDWCGHCKKMKPEFEKLKNEYKGVVKVEMINAEDPSKKELVDNQQIDGFPTVRFYPNGLNGTHENYEGGRSFKELKHFLDKL
jgi:thiol-disulfide isomerase/thioredoxin